MSFKLACNDDTDATLLFARGAKTSKSHLWLLLWQGLQKSGFVALCVLKPRKSACRFGCLACKVCYTLKILPEELKLSGGVDF